MTIGETAIDATVAHPARRYHYWLDGRVVYADSALLTSAPASRISMPAAVGRKP
jgi:hypothetical protein